jgi:choline monooxygenase
LAGEFLHQPQFREAVDFPRPCDHLAALPMATFAGMRFVSLAPSVTFENWVADVLQYIGWMPLQDFRLEPARSRDYEVNANWALYCDNYLEGLHIPFVHPALNEALDYGTYETRLLRYGNLQIGYGKPGETVFDIPEGWPCSGQPVAGLYFWLFPNLMLNFYPWGLSVNVVQPTGPATCQVVFRSYVWRPELLNTGASADLHQTEMEDEVVVESVQTGLKSRLYTRGRYSPTGEKGVHHFHQLLLAALA